MKSKKNKLTVRIISMLLIAALVSVFVLSLAGCSRKQVSTDATEDDSAALMLSGLSDEPVEMVVDTSSVSDTSSSDVSTESVTSVNSSEASIGSMTYFPFGDGKMAALMGTNVLTLYFKTTGLIYGSGSITAYDSGTNQVFETIDVNDTSKCAISDIDSAGKSLTSWESGKMVKLTFDTAFSANRSYYVLMDEGCFTNGDASSKAILDPTSICFSVKPYGIGTNNIQTAYTVQSSCEIPVVISGDCVSAQVKEYDGSFVALSSTSLSESGSITVSFLKAGNPSVTIKFLDSDGVELDSVSFSFTVVE